MFHGTLSAYTPAAGLTPGSITILISQSNKAGRGFVGQYVTFTLAASRAPRG